MRSYKNDIYSDVKWKTLLNYTVVGITNNTCASDKSIVFRLKQNPPRILYFCLPVINEFMRCNMRSTTGNSRHNSENFVIIAIVHYCYLDFHFRSEKECLLTFVLEISNN